MYIVRPLDDFFRQFTRNRKWGSCVECPVDSEGHRYPEFCEKTESLEHNLGMKELAYAHQRLEIDRN